MDQNNSTTNKRRWKQILEKERYQIESLLKAGLTPLLIGIQMDRDSRSIEWEIKRESNSSLTKEIRYCADVGQRVHEECAANVFCKRKFLTFANFFPHPIGGEFLIIAAIFQLFILRLLSRNT